MSGAPFASPSAFAVRIAVAPRLPAFGMAMTRAAGSPQQRETRLPRSDSLGHRRRGRAEELSRDFGHTCRS